MPAFSQGHFQLFVLLLCRTEKTELILQKTLNYGETLNGGARLDIDAEKKVAMRVLGIRRARIHEWTNTYSFRKARERCSWDTSRRMFNS
ncbi:fatty acyl-CoA reductase 3 isoform X2 [Capsicum annuum]|uniref:fatty acyl-CoA reductase 3 isoform X2 n=1 Tax=Capsicum annuum TaxID=4072 RepID=UPI0007BFDA36|nr:fatty acyl-CoA reductase 3 isoform X2 [Capsicum annuum]